MKDFDKLVEFEIAFDRGDRIQMRQVWKDFDMMLIPFFEGNWNELYKRTKQVYAHQHDLLARAFALHWAISAAEVTYDLNQRKLLLDEWKNFPNWATSSYCRFLRAMQDGQTAFYEAYLNDAEYKWKLGYSLACEMGYVRGQMKALFLLSLIYRDRCDYVTMKDHLDRAFSLASLLKAKNYIERIQAQQVKFRLISEDQIKSEITHPEFIKIRIETLLKSRKFDEARDLLARAEVARRRQGIRRKMESYYCYLPLLAIHKNRFALAARLLNRIHDSVIKVRILELKDLLFGLEPGELNEKDFLSRSLGFANIIQNSASKDEVIICGINLLSISNVEVVRLMGLLLSGSCPVSKETICRDVFGLNYDPIVHDRKIYKLLHLCKLTFKRRDLFLNSYGFYEINPKFLGRKDKVTTGLSAKRISSLRIKNTA